MMYDKMHYAKLGLNFKWGKYLENLHKLNFKLSTSQINQTKF